MLRHPRYMFQVQVRTLETARHYMRRMMSGTVPLLVGSVFDIRPLLRNPPEMLLATLLSRRLQTFELALARQCIHTLVLLLGLD